jgi:uncharacterized membrane protein
VKNRLLTLLRQLRASYWFLPTAMSVGAALLAFAAISIDQTLSLEFFRRLGFEYFNEPSGASALVSTIASSMITVAGTTFSITLAVLSLTSSQFGPRLLNNFMRDRGNQIVLGTFVSTYLYCLFVLRAIRESGPQSEDAFIPHLAVLLAIFFAVASLGVFIYFIHHTAESIQASTILSRVSGELEAMIRKLYPEESETTPRPPLSPELFDPCRAEVLTLTAQKSAYVQSVHEGDLLDFAAKHGVTLRSLHLPGTFLLARQPALYLWPAGGLGEDASKKVSSFFELGPRRTPERDLDFLFDQLSEMGLRALSPGVNDPVTAIHCIDRVAQGLNLMASRAEPATERYDAKGTLRLFLPRLELGTLVGETLGEMRRFSQDSLLVSQHLLRTIGTLLENTEHESLHRALRHEAELVVKGAETQLLAEDVAELRTLYESVVSPKEL